MYLKYCVWCTQNGCNAVKKNNLSKEIKKQFGFTVKAKSVNGKATKVFVKEEV